MQDKTIQPACVTETHLLFLDALRLTGLTNMYGARPYIQKAFNGMDDRTASKILAYWMASFEERHPDPDSEARQ